MTDNYELFVQRKKTRTQTIGFKSNGMNDRMRDDQKLVTDRALKAGRYAIFADCGLGKTLDQLEWAKQVVRERGPVLILAPLCVSIQTKKMSEEFGYDVTIARSQSDCSSGINITNYERLDKFDATMFSGIVLDESSILKNYSGKIRCAIIDMFRKTPMRLAATATPAPNDFMELGNHSEFLGIMSRSEMLSRFFVHDGGQTQKWRLKGHAVKAFWNWVGTWSTTYSLPSDLHPKYCDEGFHLSDLKNIECVLELPAHDAEMLFKMPVETLMEQRKIKRESIDRRVNAVADLVSKAKDFWVIWCDLNQEGDTMEKAIKDSVQICGRDSIERKEEILWAFTTGKIKTLITKQKITSFGLNWQHCCRTVFSSINYSYEGAYQAIRRFHRFGQKRDVEVHWVMMDLEYNVYAALTRKMEQHRRFKEEMKCKIS